eukprot:8398577-Pyramimonas_sp.AAC.1
MPQRSAARRAGPPGRAGSQQSPLDAKRQVLAARRGGGAPAGRAMTQGSFMVVFGLGDARSWGLAPSSESHVAWGALARRAAA